MFDGTQRVVAPQGRGSAPLAVVAASIVGLMATVVTASPRSTPQIETVRFGTAPTYPVNYASRSADEPTPFLTKDLDGTNGPDLITANTDSMLVLLNVGNGTLGSPVGFGMGLTLNDLALADLDGDGRPDAIGAGSDATGPALVVRRGLPGLDFGPAQRRALRAMPNGIAAGDWDGDGYPDVVVVSAAEDSLWVLRNDGTGALAGTSAVPLPMGARSFLLADLDGDGRLDAVTLKARRYPPAPDSSVCVLMNRVGSVSAVFYETGEPANAVAPARSDAPGRLDLAILTDTHVFLMRGRGDGSFANPDTLFQIAWTHAYPLRGIPRSIQSGDIDGDGRPDLVFLNLQWDYWDGRNYVAISRGLGAGGFDEPRRYHTPVAPDRMLVSDLDHDGALDIAVLARGGASSVVGDPIPPGVTVYRNYEGGRMPGTLEVEFDPSRFEQADFPGAIESGRFRAGRPRDLIVTDGGWTFVLHNDAKDEFSKPIGVGPGRLSAVVDLDGDGWDELVLAGHDSTRVWRSRGDGSFAMTGEYVGGVWIGLGDIDADGRDDLALRQGNQLAMRRGLGKGTFGDVESRGLVLRPEATAVLVKDLNGDGHADVACGLNLAASPEDTLTISLNLGNGGWNDPISVGLPQPDWDYGSIPPRFIVAGDMDHDGRLDVVVLQTAGMGTDGAGFLNVVHSDPSGAYSCSGFDDPSNSPSDLHVADLNRDGFPEALTVNSNGGLTFHFYFYENDGHGFLLPWERYRVTDFSTNVTAADLDDDGLLDIATYTPRFGSVTIVRNVSAPQLPTAVVVSLVSCTTDPGVVRLEWYGAREVTDVTLQRRSSSSADWARIASLSPDAQGFVRYADRSVLPGTRYAYRLRVGGTAGGMLTSESWVDVPALTVQLRGVRPNPFRSNALVGFSLPAPATASLEVLDVAGRKVREQRVEGLPAGEHQVRLDSNGAPLRSGVYLIRLIALGQARTARAIVVE